MFGKKKKQKCNSCRSTDLLRIYQIGLDNIIKSEASPQPEAIFNILICKKCGSVKVDLNTLVIKERYNIWPARY